MSTLGSSASAIREVELLLEALAPNAEANARRTDISTFVGCVLNQGKRGKASSCQIFGSGSFTSRTYLPVSDIDLVLVTGDANGDSTDNNNGHDSSSSNSNEMEYILSVFEALCTEVSLRDAGNSKLSSMQNPMTIRNVEFINARTKLCHCLVNNVGVDVTINSAGALTTVLFIEECDRYLGNNHIFKRSLVLIKAWALNESPNYVGQPLLGSKTGMLSSYALCVLVLYLFNQYPNLSHPFSVLLAFLHTYAEISWDNCIITVQGPMTIAPAQRGSGSIQMLSCGEGGSGCAPSINTSSSSGNSPSRLGPFLSRFSSTIESLHTTDNSSSDSCSNSSSNSKAPTPARSGGGARWFALRSCNIQDPVEANNNLGHSVTRHNLELLSKALRAGRDHFQHMLRVHYQDSQVMMPDLVRRVNDEAVAAVSQQNIGGNLRDLPFVRRLFPTSFRECILSLGTRSDLLDHPMQTWGGSKAGSNSGEGQSRESAAAMMPLSPQEASYVERLYAALSSKKAAAAATAASSSPAAIDTLSGELADMWTALKRVLAKDRRAAPGATTTPQRSGSSVDVTSSLSPAMAATGAGLKEGEATSKGAAAAAAADGGVGVSEKEKALQEKEKGKAVAAPALCSVGSPHKTPVRGNDAAPSFSRQTVSSPATNQSHSQPSTSRSLIESDNENENDDDTLTQGSASGSSGPASPVGGSPEGTSSSEVAAEPEPEPEPEWSVEPELHVPVGVVPPSGGKKAKKKKRKGSAASVPVAMAPTVSSSPGSGLSSLLRGSSGELNATLDDSASTANKKTDAAATAVNQSADTNDSASLSSSSSIAWGLNWRTVCAVLALALVGVSIRVHLMSSSIAQQQQEQRQQQPGATSSSKAALAPSLSRAEAISSASLDVSLSAVSQISSVSMDGDVATAQQQGRGGLKALVVDSVDGDASAILSSSSSSSASASASASAPAPVGGARTESSPAFWVTEGQTITLGPPSAQCPLRGMGPSLRHLIETRGGAAAGVEVIGGDGPDKCPMVVPPARFQWRLNGEPLTEPGNGGAFYTVHDASLESQGEYTCVVQLGASQATSALALGGELNIAVSGRKAASAEEKQQKPLELVLSRALVQLSVAPEITKSKSAFFDLAEGQPLYLDVNAEGSPPPAFQWYLNGVALPGEVRKTLNVGNIKKEHAGAYTCEVSNVAGSVTFMDVTVSVRSSPNAEPTKSSSSSSSSSSGSSGGSSGSATKNKNKAPARKASEQKRIKQKHL